MTAGTANPRAPSDFTTAGVAVLAAVAWGEVFAGTVTLGAEVGVAFTAPPVL